MLFVTGRQFNQTLFNLYTDTLYTVSCYALTLADDMLQIEDH